MLKQIQRWIDANSRSLQRATTMRAPSDKSSSSKSTNLPANVPLVADEETADVIERAPPCGGRCPGALGELATRLQALGSAPRELWILYLLKMLESFAYFSMSLSFTLYLTQEFGFSDLAAGTLYGVWGILISTYGFATAVLIDRLGVKRSLVLGSLLSAVGRLLFAVAPNRAILYTSMFLLMPIGLSLGIPVMTIAIKRYTNQENRSTAFGVYYSMMNVSALVSGLITDSFNLSAFRRPVTVNGFELSSFRVLFLVGTVSTLLYGIIALVAVREIDVNKHGQLDRSVVKRRSLRKTVSLLRSDTIFWRLAAFSAVMLGAKIVFRQLDSSLPKYMRRTLGDDARYGAVYSVNPFMIIFLAPLCSALLTRFDIYRVITIGSLIAALSVFAMLIDASYTSTIIFVVGLSFGEALYSPKLYDYTMAVAPRGDEGIYTQLASAPMFVAKIGAGSLSGFLLETYCPSLDEDNQVVDRRRCTLVWLWVGLLSLSSPLLLVALRRYIYSPEVRQRIAHADDSVDEIQAKAMRVRVDDEGEEEQVVE